jgi:hypothetical protein
MVSSGLGEISTMPRRDPIKRSGDDDLAVINLSGSIRVDSVCEAGAVVVSKVNPSLNLPELSYLTRAKSAGA